MKKTNMININNIIDVQEFQDHAKYGHTWRRIKSMIKIRVQRVLWEMLYMYTKSLEHTLQKLEIVQRNQFLEKYSQEQILIISMYVPQEVPKTILGISEWTKLNLKEALTSRQISKIKTEIELHFPTYWEKIKYEDQNGKKWKMIEI